MPVAALLALGLLRQGPTAATPPPPKLAIVDQTVGTGDPVANGDFVTVEYTGMLTNGTVFDTSKKPGRQPFSFFVGFGQVIPGWDQGLIGMKVGGVRKLTIPPDLAYGANGAPPTIPPNSTLVFTISLSKDASLKSPTHPITTMKINVTKPGTGGELTFGGAAMLKIKGTTPDGAVFLNTADGMPDGVRFEIGKFHGPSGFTLGVLGMKVGEKRTVSVPPDLAFGATGYAQLNIKPNTTVSFDFELVSLIDPKAVVRNKDSR